MDSFINRIVETTNYFVEEVLLASKSGFPIYIYGGGQGAAHVCRKLELLGVQYDGKVVDKGFSNSELIDIDTMFRNSPNKVNLIIAHRGFIEDKLSKYRNKINMIINRDCFCGNMASVCDYITYDWLVAKQDELQWMYDQLQDSISKDTFVAYVNQKLSAKQGYLNKVKSENQYFDEMVRLGTKEIFIDCGGYTGDTADAFIEALQKRNIETYQEIISFEPDNENIIKMKERKLKKHKCMQMCVGDRAGFIFFEEKGSATSVISESGKNSVPINTIDNVMSGEMVTFIKMDIEGSELEALKGAETTISTYHPTLAISIYHKKEDLYEIGKYIHSLCDTYKFYIRAYYDEVVDVVLYAIP